jgi:hypothetical protein
MGLFFTFSLSCLSDKYSIKTTVCYKMKDSEEKSAFNDSDRAGSYSLFGTRL